MTTLTSDALHRGSRFLREHLATRARFLAANSAFVARRRQRNSFFHEQVNRLVASQTAGGRTIIDVGCADGLTLAACNHEHPIGIDVDQAAIEEARRLLPEADFVEAAIEDVEASPATAPDHIVMSLLLDEVYDADPVLRKIRSWCVPDTRVVVVTYNRLWRPALRVAERLRLKVRTDNENYIPWVELENLLAVTGFETAKRLDGILLPVQIPLVSRFTNRWIAPLPVIRQLSMVRVTVARPVTRTVPPPTSVSVVVAARNEAGNIDQLIERVPKMAVDQEIVFVEGGSTDDTWEVIGEAVANGQSWNGTRLRALRQPGTGKGDAVRAGFDAATGEVLVILDADLSVPPEELPRFVAAVTEDACEFANGSRLVYPMDSEAMRFLNLVGNKLFGNLFTFLLSQPIRDTLCGTKALRADAYRRIAAGRSQLGEFDPFGDFDLLFGASRLGLRIRDIPVHYKERTYGATNISRFSHGVLLLRMSRVAALRLKFVG
ncbi:MAG TPA: glycosyltransferase [Actinomycetota bacterium]|nr:glycosyltransferase [Actinomycetota bacterium]